MDEIIESVNYHLISSAVACEQLYSEEDHDNPPQDIAELENTLHTALRQIAEIKQKRAI